MTRMPSSSRRLICPVFSSPAHQRLEIGHTVRPSPRRFSSAVSFSLSRMFTPWSIRSTPMTSRHWRMCSIEFGWSVSQCIVI